MELRQDRMTHEERMDALFNYQKPDRIPIGPMSSDGFFAKNAGNPIVSAFNDPQKSFYAKTWTAGQYGWELVPFTFAHTILGGWDFGGEIQMPGGEYRGALAIKSYPVKTESDVCNLKMPDPKTAGGLIKAMEFSKIQEEKGMPIWFFSRSPFCVASNICGLEQFCRWMIKKTELCQRLLRMATDHIFNVLQYWVDTFGAEKIFFAMSSPSESNQVISPRQLKQFALPYHIELQDKLWAIGIKRFWFHICGEQNGNLPYLAELSSKWPHPSILSFEPAIIQTGTAQQVYELCRIAIEKGKKSPGGFMLAPGCGLPVMAPPVNLYAMTKAVNNFGWYN